MAVKRYYSKSADKRDPDFEFAIGSLSAGAHDTIKKYQAKMQEAATAEMDAKKILSDGISLMMRSANLLANNEFVAGYVREKDNHLVLYKKAITPENKPIVDIKPSPKAKAIF